MHTSQGPASLTTHLLGPHPVVAHFIQRLHLPAIVHQTVGHGRELILDHGTTLAVLIHNILDSPAPLYRIAEWASPIAPQALSLTPEQKQSLQDDRRFLERLLRYSAGENPLSFRTDAVPTQVIELLSRSAGILELLPEAYLAGGTALSLYFAHRVSVDLDFFVPQSFLAEDLRPLSAILPR